VSFGVADISKVEAVDIDSQEVGNVCPVDGEGQTVFEVYIVVFAVQILPVVDHLNC
jgi:hypothetical protein